MQVVPYNEIENATEADVGRVCLMQLGCNPLAIEDTLEECIRVAERLAGEPIDRNEIDDHTDLHYLTTDDVVAVEIR